MVGGGLGEAVFPEQSLDGPAAQGAGGLPEGVYVGAVQRRCQLVQKLRILPKSLGGGGEAGGDAGILLFQQGHQMMPQPVTEEFVAAVGAVLHMADVVFVQKGLHLGPGHIQHGPDEPVGLWRDAAQAPQARATDQVHQHRFGVVVGGVGGGDGAIEAAKICVSRFPCRRFQPLGAGNHSSGAQMQGDIVEIAEFFNKFRIPLRFLPPEVVVKMGSLHGDAQLLLQQPHPPQQRHGVGTAGYGAEDPVPRLHHLIPAEGGEHLIQHASTPGRRRWCTGAATGA